LVDQVLAHSPAEHRSEGRSRHSTFKGWDVLGCQRTGQTVKLSSDLALGSELVHLGGGGGHTSRAGPEVRVDGNGSADRDDATQTVTVMADAVTHGKHLVRRDRISGGIEGAGGQATPLHRRGHVPIILLQKGFR